MQKVCQVAICAKIGVLDGDSGYAGLLKRVAA